MTIPAVKEPKKLAPEVELERLENNEILNELLDALDEGKTISKADQQFVDECLDRIAQLMEELGIQDEDETEDDLYRTSRRLISTNSDNCHVADYFKYYCFGNYCWRIILCFQIT